MRNNKKMKYSTCAVCGKRSLQPKLTEDQAYGWTAKYLDGMPDYRDVDQVVIPEVCPYCGFSYPLIEENYVTVRENLETREFRNLFAGVADGATELIKNVEACVRAAYVMEGNGLRCYRLALKQYLTAVWLLDALLDAQANSSGGNETGRVECQKIHDYCLERALYCCNILRRKSEDRWYSLMLLDLYRRRGLMELAVAFAEEMLEGHEWNTIEEKLMMKHQMELGRKGSKKPATLLMDTE